MPFFRASQNDSFWVCEYSDRFYMNNIDTVDGVKHFPIVTFPAKCFTG
ncbi:MULTISPECIES: hypothetical protein [Okeania]|nr:MULTISPECIES: hypothetical protein [Okeania]NEP40212.1 hypothetical protein [Okeania sp. SIO2H7]NET12014.1 hypothetical protein [Okeania sp. SIO1H6]NEP71328.1 hypothetical protein [Okeania sp. SIO2G5]NEP91978.1 hypothetical protein [Okeania sp. SIO2F5]NEQ89455.1 hypothetical protein [Okeania sp. SIO2G4]